MKKLILIIFSFVFLSNNVVAKDMYLNELNKWLLDNGHTQYLNFEHKAGCKKLIQKHGLKVPKVGLFGEPKVKTNEWFWLGCHKLQFTNNLKIKVLLRFEKGRYNCLETARQITLFSALYGESSLFAGMSEF